MLINEKALEAAVQVIHAAKHVYNDNDLASNAIRAYIEAATPPDVAGLIDEAQDFAELMTGQPWACELIEKLSDALRLSAGGGVPEGWKLVPVDPTPEMLGAFWRQKNCGTQEVGERGPHTDDCSAYRAMLAASPTVEADHVE